MDFRFFDHNATTPLWPEARTAWLKAEESYWLNPSSPYRGGAAVKVRLESAREFIAEKFDLDPSRMLFNSGATEGNNSVFAHWASVLPSDGNIAVSPVEHPSVLAAARHYFSGRIEWLPILPTGGMDLAWLKAALTSGRIAAVSCMAANNETGLCYDWRSIAELCRSAGVPYHCDASQWIGKLPLEGFAQVDYVTGCAHKFGGPKGVGFLIRPKSGGAFTGFLGGAQEFGQRAGTESVAGVLAMEAALTVSSTHLAPGHSRTVLRDDFIAGLKARLSAVKIVGEGETRLWNTVSVIMPEFASVRWIRALEKRGFLVSAGSACSTGRQGPSHVLAAMGYEAVAMRRVLRISSGWMTTADDWTALLDGIMDVYQALREESDASTSRVIEI